MKVAPLYRTLLKQLAEACVRCPHYVQDVRFLLSRPLMLHGTSASPTSSPRTRLTKSSASLSPSDPFSVDTGDGVHNETSAAPSELSSPSTPPSPHSTSVEPGCTLATDYLSRSPAQCYRIDRDVLFEVCKEDLRGCIDQSVQQAASSQAAAARPGAVRSPSATPALSPVALQVLHYRDLLWLQKRLARILSDATTRRLGQVLDIATGPTAKDFIPDEFFTPSGSGTRGSTDSAGSQADPASPGPQGKESSGAIGTDASVVVDKKTGATTVSNPHLPVPSGASDERAANEVISAGAIGFQHEVFVVRQKGEFPMAARFLSDFHVLDADQLQAKSRSHADLVELVRHKVPTTTVCRNEDVKLTVQVAPFDLRYTNRDYAGVGYFATAHRQFNVKFTFTPQDTQARVQIVNSYFARLDVAGQELVEEVGYLHSYDVMRMLQERDNGAAFHKTPPASPPKTSAPDAASTPDPTGEGREFELYFFNYSDSPSVLKGVFYYKTGTGDDVRHEPIKMIPFGLVLLNS